MTTGSAEITLPRRLTGEALGSAGLAFAAGGIEVLAHLYPTEFPTEARAIGPALIILSLIYGLGKTSGAHFNPVVTIAFTCRGAFPWKLVPFYVMAQLVGAMLAAWLLIGFFGAQASASLSRPVVSPAIAVAAEITLSFFLVFVILSTATQHQILGPSAALPVGMTIAGCNLLGLKLSGPSMNPIRSLGPALVFGDYSHLWIYIVGPLSGALLACGIFSLLESSNGDEKKAACGEEN